MWFTGTYRFKIRLFAPLVFITSNSLFVRRLAASRGVFFFCLFIFFLMKTNTLPSVTADLHLWKQHLLPDGRAEQLVATHIFRTGGRRFQRHRRLAVRGWDGGRTHPDTTLTVLDIQTGAAQSEGSRISLVPSDCCFAMKSVLLISSLAGLTALRILSLFWGYACHMFSAIYFSTFWYCIVDVPVLLRWGCMRYSVIVCVLATGNNSLYKKKPAVKVGLQTIAPCNVVNVRK